MTTNDKEYQRDYQREYRKSHPQKQYRKVKKVKTEVKVLENLHPPVEVGEKTVHQDDREVRVLCGSPSEDANSKPTDMGLDFYAIANSSDFQRFIVFLAKKITPELFKGVSTRVTSSVMKEQFNDTRADYRLVMAELKEKLKERRENG